MIKSGYIWILAMLLILAGAAGAETRQPYSSGCSTAGAAVGWIAGSHADGHLTILHTTDAGKDWTRQAMDPSLPVVNLTGIHAVDDCTAWAVGQNVDGYGVILHTSDGGETWKRQGNPGQVPDAELVGVYAIDPQTVWVAGYDGIILKSADGGLSWTRQAQEIAPPVMLSGIYAADQDYLWVVGTAYDGYGTILHSADGGQTWERQRYTPRPDVLDPYLITCHGWGRDVVWAVGRGTAIMTSDGGANWTDVTPQGGVGAYDVNGVYVKNADTAWLVQDNDGLYVYNQGQWQQQSVPVRGHHLLRVTALSDDQVWVTGVRNNWDSTPGVILYSPNGADPWLDQKPGVAIDLWGVSFVRGSANIR